MRFNRLLISICIVLMACNRENLSDEQDSRKATDPAASAVKTNTFDRSGYADVNGIKMYYEIYGQGKPLVLIHGGGSTIETTFGRIIPYLSKTRQLIGVELQAHGHTSDRDSDLSFEQDADDVIALLKSLNVTKADFFGFSNGGNTALQIAIRHPQIVDRVIAASSLLKRNGTIPEFWKFMEQAKLEHMPMEYKQAFLKINPDTIKLKTLHDKCAKRMVEFRDLPDDEIKSISAPVLLVNADADVATPEHTLQMSRLIPDCKIAIIPGGHGEYLGEITTLKPGKNVKLPILPIVETFLD